MIMTRKVKNILTRRRDNYDKDSWSDIDKVKRQGEDNCDSDKDKMITERRIAVILKRQSD